MKRYFLNVLIGIDQLANALLGPGLNLLFGVRGFGDPDETLSSVFGKNQATCKGCYWVCRLLHRFDPHHCEKSIERDEGLPGA